jgi:transposase
MLHKDKNIIAPETFKLIQELQSLPELKDFYLVGGTTLALLLGHRNSIDIDLFSVNNFEPVEIMEMLSGRYNVLPTTIRKNTLLSKVNDIKVDFISHPYKIIKPIIIEENISMLSLEDISAMKLNAIINSGQRIKDFIDIYFLLEHFSIDQMLYFYQEKYLVKNDFIPLKALTYFDDIDLQIDPPKLLKPLPLKIIQQRIIEGVKHPNKIFNP